MKRYDPWTYDDDMRLIQSVGEKSWIDVANDLGRSIVACEGRWSTLRTILTSRPVDQLSAMRAAILDAVIRRAARGIEGMEARKKMWEDTKRTGGLKR